MRTISVSARTEKACVFPTVLAELPKVFFIKAHRENVADIAMRYFDQQGFKSDRTKMNQNGYPGLFRELKSPPPWIEVTQEDVECEVTAERVEELQPLFHHACNSSMRDLLDKYEEYLKKIYANSKPHGIVLSSNFIDGSLELLKEKLQLARCIGAEHFENIFDAVFDFDELSLASGAPDLFVWDPNENMWFFAEIKGPNDHLRQSQAEWVRINWDRINGHFILFVFSPDK